MLLVASKTNHEDRLIDKTRKSSKQNDIICGFSDREQRPLIIRFSVYDVKAMKSTLLLFPSYYIDPF